MTSPRTPDPTQLVWKDGYRKKLTSLEMRVGKQSMTNNFDYTMYAYLLHLIYEWTLTPDAVIDYVCRELAPEGGWIDFDREKWLGYVPQVEEVLRAI